MTCKNCERENPIICEICLKKQYERHFIFLFRWVIVALAIIYPFNLIAINFPIISESGWLSFGFWGICMCIGVLYFNFDYKGKVD